MDRFKELLGVADVLQGQEPPVVQKPLVHRRIHAHGLRIDAVDRLEDVDPILLVDEAVSPVEPLVHAAEDAVGMNVVRVHLHGEVHQRCDLGGAHIGIQLSPQTFDKIGDHGQLSCLLQLPEKGDHHFPLPFRSEMIQVSGARALSHTQIRQDSVAIQVTLPSAKDLTAVKIIERDLRVEVDAADGIDKVEYRLIVQAKVIWHRHAAQPHLRRPAGELQTCLRILQSTAHVEDTIELIVSRPTGHIGEGIPGDGDQADLPGVEVHRHDHVGVRMDHGPAGGTAVLKSVQAKESDVDDAGKRLPLRQGIHIRLRHLRRRFEGWDGGRSCFFGGQIRIHVEEGRGGRRRHHGGHARRLEQKPGLIYDGMHIVCPHGGHHQEQGQ